jgi:cysteine desulfurase
VVAAGRLYLDCAAAAPLDPRVAEAMAPYVTRGGGNPSSVHAEGRAARLAVDQARREVALLLGCRPREVVFTSGGTEANHLALWGACLAAPAGGEVVVGGVEHPSVLESARRLARLGVGVRVVAPDPDGRLDPGAVLDVVSRRTLVVSLQVGNHEVGTVQPVAETAAAVRARFPGVLFHTDAVAAAPELPVDVTALGVDLLSLSALKIGGPYGAGALYVRSGSGLAPVLGGGDQERGRRPGTENVPAIVGLGRAAALLTAERPDRLRRLGSVREALLAGLREALGADGVAVNGPDAVADEASIRPGAPAAVMPGIVSLTFPGTPSDSLLIRLDGGGIAASAGSACAAGSLDPSPVLLAMGRSAEAARQTVRLSPPWDLTPRRAAEAAHRLAASVLEVRAARSQGWRRAGGTA